MWKFLAGIVAGTAVAILYVLFNVQLPAVLQLPALVRGGAITTTTEAQLYDPQSDNPARLRALEVYFANRAQDAAAVDADAGHPFLETLHRARGRQEAQRLSTKWEAYDQVLAQPALRGALEREYREVDTIALKQAMLWEAQNEYLFLKQWLTITYGPQSEQTLYTTLLDARRVPAPQTR